MKSIAIQNLSTFPCHFQGESKYLIYLWSICTLMFRIWLYVMIDLAAAAFHIKSLSRLVYLTRKISLYPLDDIFASISPTQPILENYTVGCASLSPPYIASVSVDSSCSGIQFCQTTFPNDIQSSLLHVYSINTGSRAWKSFPCALVIISQRTFPLSKFIKFASSYQNKHFKNVSIMAPLVLDWAIRNGTCIEAQAHKRVKLCGMWKKQLLYWQKSSHRRIPLQMQFRIWGESLLPRWLQRYHFSLWWFYEHWW